MAYSPLLMTLIFIKPPQARCGEVISLAPAKMRPRPSRARFDLRPMCFGRRVTEATRPANTCVSTPSLCNANFARS